MNERKMLYFLHSKGYNLFTIPKLTYPEMNFLVEMHNDEVKEQKRQMKKQQAKGKGKR